MKPEKSKKAQAPAKIARPSAKSEPSAKAAPPPPPPPAPPKKSAARKIKDALLSVKEKLTAAARPSTAKRTQPAKLTAAAKPRPTPAPRAKTAVPPLLLEGDADPAPRLSGPGQRYALGTIETLSTLEETAELPEAYGTQRLLLVARDPHWIYAHWDLTSDQLREYNDASRDGHLILRVFVDQPGGPPLVEQHVHPESRNWFVHVGHGGKKYVAELGYFNRRRAWKTVATSGATLTPPDVLSDDTSVRFETIPVEVPFKKLLELVKAAVAEHTPLVEAIQQLRAAGHVDLPKLELAYSGSASAVSGETAPHWTPQQERALAQIINIDEVRRVWMGSLEITELIRRSLAQEISSQAAAALGRGESVGGARLAGVTSVSSPFGGVEKRKGFWFNVNAELIIYGATEPDAAVTIGGRKIQLRPDGTFSFRFALPDGHYDLPVQATSADASDSRRAELKFSRATQYRGEVGRHPQDAKLKTPRVENVV